jgi:predicted nucleic acid-binding protein
MRRIPIGLTDPQGGGTSFVDRVTITYARRHKSALAFAFDGDLRSAGLAPLE